jgi:hypothetical protein
MKNFQMEKNKMDEEERDRIQRLCDEISLTCLNAKCRMVWFGYSPEYGDRCQLCNCIGVEDPNGNQPAPDAVEQEWKRLNPGIRTKRDLFVSDVNQSTREA